MSLPVFQALDEWPAPEYAPEPTRFRAGWSSTLTDLTGELRAIEATNPILRVVADPQAVRRDGMLRSDAKVRHHGAILEFSHPTHGQLAYTCARYTAPWGHQGPSWQHNVRAIVQTLNALRAVERYGAVSGGQQYVGFRALGSGTPMGSGSKMTVEAAARLLIDATDEEVATAQDVIVGRADPQVLYRVAAKRLHPDLGGDPETFRRLTEARDLLVGQAQR